MTNASKEKYALGIRLLHWIMAIMIIGLIISGLIMVNIPKSDPQHHIFFKFHKSFGITILLLVTVRLFIRIRYAAPDLPEIISALTRKIASGAHWVLYALMIVTPVSGFLMSTWKGQPIAWFGLTLPHLSSIDDVHANIAERLHHSTAYILLALLFLHISAVVFHLIKHKINLIKRMV